MSERIVTYPAAVVEDIACRLCDLDVHLPFDDAEEMARDIVLDVTRAVDVLRRSEA